MVWGWFRDWRERRATLRDFDTWRSREERPLLESNLNPLALARVAIDTDDLVAAAEHWERARVQLPNAILTRTEPLDILLDLKRFDEAEALMRDRHARLPSDRFWMAGLARISEKRGDPAEGLKRWEAVTRRRPSDLEGLLGRARCLLALDRLDEAEALCKTALRQVPNEARAWMDLIRIAERREDWEQALSASRHMAIELGFVGIFANAARALTRLGWLDEAEAMLLEPSMSYPRDISIAMARIDLAEARGDKAAVLDRWRQLRRADPYWVAGYSQGAIRLAEAGLHDEADAVLRSAIERFPEESWPLHAYAAQADARGDHDEAKIRWAALSERFPSG